jgi:hypothetical protein
MSIIGVNMKTDAENKAILESFKPEISQTFCCPGCNGKTRDVKDRVRTPVESYGRKTMVTRCLYCIGFTK